MVSFLKRTLHVCLILAALPICLTSRAADAAVTRSPYLFRQPDASGPAPVLEKYRDAGDDRIPDQYIVVLSDDVLPDQVPAVARDLGLSQQFTPRKIWQHAIKGFSAAMPQARARALSHNPLVKYVEENAQWYLSGVQRTNINPVTCDPTLITCTGAGIVTDNRLWHLDRADQNYPDPTNTYSYCTDGSGVTVYVVDTGVNKSHQEFGSRVTHGYNATGDATTNDHMPADDPCLGFAVPPNTLVQQEVDNYNAELSINGHGTAVASALGGTRVGVAKGVTIVPIKVVRCDVNASRLRISGHPYTLNKTIYHPNGNSFDAVYRCITAGTSLSSDPGGWPTAADATKTDGTVVWQVLKPNEIRPSLTAATDMIIDGLNWILTGDNDQGPKSNAIVSMSEYRRADDINGTTDSVEAVVRRLLASNITVVASANNQNGNACDTSPARISADNPIDGLKGNVITVGGSMLINRPWKVDLIEPPSIPQGAVAADGQGVQDIVYNKEPDYDAGKAVRDARWICGDGDSNPCTNSTNKKTADPTLLTYYGFDGGSNAGQCVTLFAPAKNLFLATNSGNGSDYRDARLRGGLGSGTSWSAPIVAGFAARLLQGPDGHEPNHLTPVQVRTALLNNSVATLEDSATYPLNTTDFFTGQKITDTPNRLLRLSDVNITEQPQDTTAISTDHPTSRGRGRNLGGLGSVVSGEAGV